MEISKRLGLKTRTDIPHYTKIIHVNQDCLESILQSVDLIDLYSLAGTHSDLRLAAENQFARKYKRKTITFCGYHFFTDVPLIELIDDGIEINQPLPAFQFLRHFGHFLSNIVIDVASIENITLRTNLVNYVNEYCSKSLISFTLRGGTKQMLNNAQNVFNRVEEVSISHSEFGPMVNLNDFFQECADCNCALMNS